MTTNVLLQQKLAHGNYLLSNYFVAPFIHFNLEKLNWQFILNWKHFSKEKERKERDPNQATV